MVESDCPNRSWSIEVAVGTEFGIGYDFRVRQTAEMIAQTEAYIATVEGIHKNILVTPHYYLPPEFLNKDQFCTRITILNPNTNST